jgi:hypothetical protein
VQESWLDLFFFNETLNAEDMHRSLGQFFPELTEKERIYGLFQQHSPTAQTARMSMQGFVRCLRGQNYQ